MTGNSEHWNWHVYHYCERHLHHFISLAYNWPVGVHRETRCSSESTADNVNGAPSTLATLAPHD
jgi:hypothetical protein